MSLKITTGYKQLVAEAEAEIETLTPEEAMALHGNPEVLFLDIRDIRELKREGGIPEAVHMPRGMLEFWVDPESPYFKKIFTEEKKFVLFCAGGWRSALAAQQLQRMGLTPVCHIEGGFTAWQKLDGPTTPPRPRN